MGTVLRLMNIHSDAFWECKKEQLDAIPDPMAKFQAFDAMTDEVLKEFTPFAMFKFAADKPEWRENMKMNSPFWMLTQPLVKDAFSLINRCKQISEYTMKDIDKSALRKICGSPDTYILTKMFRAMARIFLSPNFLYTSNPGNLLKPLYDETWNLQGYNHANLCPCYEHLTKQFA